MPTQPCANTIGSDIIAQTLFLGASISNFNVSMGWGGQPSQLTVTLIEDSASSRCLIPQNTISNQFQSPLVAANGSPLNFPPDHYHTCVGDNCYVNDAGATFVSSTMDVSQRRVPGKVYYEFFSNATTGGCFKSQYWVDPDPGFFGQPNRLQTNNTFINGWSVDNSNLNKGYDIIDTPVLFKMGDFTFGGLVQSWTQNIGQGGKIYNVTINSMQSLLNSCYIIIGSYAGAIYSKLAGSILPVSANAGPRNYTGKLGVDYFGKITEGNLPNIFNIYGFLESFGADGFGGAKLNSEGLSANSIVDALSVLTSIRLGSSGGNGQSKRLDSVFSEAGFSDYAKKTAFSPFGRILSKCMQENDTYDPISNAFNRFGVIPPSLVDQDGAQSNRCQFTLDLSEIPRFPDDVRVSGPVISITSLLNELAERGGFDYYVELVPVVDSNTIINVIKVRTISRLAQPRTNTIENTVKNLLCNGYAIANQTIGKEKNESSARYMIIGGPIQRLYQAKSYRLAYTQSNYLFDYRNSKFIDYMQLGFLSFPQGANTQQLTRTSVAANSFQCGKIKTPLPLNNHNPKFSAFINPAYSGIYQMNDDIKKAIPEISFAFEDPDNEWADDKEIKSGVTGKSSGNYGKAQIIKNETGTTATWGSSNQQRFYPLFKDVICPFFGYVLENELSVQDSNNDFRRIRPVWFDTWTGQIVVLLRTLELPATSVNLENTYLLNGLSYFLVTESEIRAAIAGFDEFLVYCLSKTYKMDLVEMLRRAYIVKDKAIYKSRGLSDADAQEAANNKHNWYWGMLDPDNYGPGSNLAGAYRQTIVPLPARVASSFEIDPAAIKDLKILHNFVSQLAQYYGKKYLVTAPYVTAYKDSSFANYVLPTDAGPAWVFQGAGELHYSYEPTNDGAWEEVGNIIDDSVVVGGKEYFALTDDVGKIKPLLGYNANDAFDYARYDACKAAQANLTSFEKDKANPFWSFEAWDIMKSRAASACNNTDFIYPVIDYSMLGADDYILVNVSGGRAGTLAAATSINPNFSFTFTSGVSRDAFGNGLPNRPMKKLYVSTNVESKILFLDPFNLKEPKFLVDAPGIPLNGSSDQYAKDPNTTIIATVAMEDIAIYLRAEQNHDYDWIRNMLSHIYPVVSGSQFLIGNDTNAANQSAAYATLAPKMAHPFFAGIPLKSNIYNYGPWVNNPYLDYLSDPEGVFPSGMGISISDAIPPICSSSGVVITSDAAKKAIDNWILSTTVEQNTDYVPWNYGGMAFLDNVAYNDTRSKTNYQNIIETAQVEIPGTPLFNLGGAFSFDYLGYSLTNPSGIEYIYKDVKYTPTDPILSANLANGPPILYGSLIPSTTTQERKYTTLIVPSIPNNFGGPVITNIQTTVGQQGISTTYSFRTYTKKLGLFNKENSDFYKKVNRDNIRRNKQNAKLNQNFSNNLNIQIRNIQKQRLENGKFATQDFKSKLYGWSPVKVLIGQSFPYIGADSLTSGVRPSNWRTQSAMPSTTSSSSSNQLQSVGGADVGDSSLDAYLTANSTIPALANTIRYRTDIGLFEDKEVNAQISKDYGLQAMMSLDGLFSPVSFYPTYKNSTFNFSLYDQSMCPFCSGSKQITIPYKKYVSQNSQSTIDGTVKIYCDKCVKPNNKLNIKLKSNTTTSAGSSLEVLPPFIITSGTDISALSQYKSSIGTNLSSSSTTATATANIPINLVTLQPIVVPYGEFRHLNAQSYSGVHPEGSGIHGDLSIGALAQGRSFFDRCRHSIEVVGRGAVKPRNINIAESLKKYELNHNPDYYNTDIRLQKLSSYTRENNIRFLGLRGPLTLHAWGYDKQGYPVPNACDEPYEIDEFNRPKRFKIKKTETANIKYGSLANGSLYSYVPFAQPNNNVYTKGYDPPPHGVSSDTDVTKIEYEDDLSNAGGFMDENATNMGTDLTIGYQGSIISKTQKYINNKWTDKIKLKEFYLNWAERPDLWPVGPIDLRWDPDRKVWSSNNDVSSIYKMVYVTLEEDLVKDDDTEDTYPARGFLDDVEYSTQPLGGGLRRLVFVKDKSGYTAPRGAKLLCRFDKDTGFYEPVSKSSFVAKGIITPGSNIADIEMSYAPGKKKGEPYPTMKVNFDNPFDLPITENKGLFTYLNSKWVLTTSK